MNNPTPNRKRAYCKSCNKEGYLIPCTYCRSHLGLRVGETSEPPQVVKDLFGHLGNNKARYKEDYKPNDFDKTFESLRKPSQK